MKRFSGFVSRLVGTAIAVSAVSFLTSAQGFADEAPGAARKAATSIPGARIPAAAEVRVIVPCPVDSPTDIFARRFAQILSRSSGRQFYVENVASSALDTAETREALADGRTILFVSADPALPSACGE